MAADGKSPPNWRHAMVSLIARILILPLLLAQPPDPGLPSRLEVMPNAIVDPKRPMTIEVSGIPPSETVRLQVLQDCDGDGVPDLLGRDGCPSPLEERDSSKAGSDKEIRDRLNFQEIDQALQRAGKLPLPRKQPLWLRASRQGSKQGRLVIFGLVESQDVCSLWRTTVETFFGGRCNPSLLRALRRHRGVSREPRPLFEVRRINTRVDNPRALPIPRTHGATGVAWADRETLLVTIGDAASREKQTSSSTARATPAPLPEGIWQMSVVNGELRLLWAKPREEYRQTVAPLSLPGGRIAFVRQSIGEEVVEGEEPPALLSIWQGGKLDPERDVPLPYKIHQLLASDTQGERILALTLGAAGNRPAFLQIDLIQRTVQNLGYDPALYQAALRSPEGVESVVAFEDNSGQNGWELVLVDSQGKILKDLQTRGEDDLKPTWQTGGKEVAFLAEVERKEKQ